MKGGKRGSERREDERVGCFQGSQERFSPSIGVLKAPWIINGLSLRSNPPILLFLFTSLFSFFPFPSPSFFGTLLPSCVCFHLSPLLFCSLSLFLPPPPKFISAFFLLNSHFSFLFSRALDPPLPPKFISFSLIPLFSISSSI